MRKMYLTYPILQTVSAKLTWSHYVELLKIEDPLERSFYEKEAENEQWGVRELKRQMQSMLFHRIALSSDKQEVLRLSKEGQIIERPEDMVQMVHIKVIDLPCAAEVLHKEAAGLFSKSFNVDRIFFSLMAFHRLSHFSP